MALTDELSRLLGFDQPGNNAEISFKLKPILPPGQAEATIGGAPSDPALGAGGAGAGDTNASSGGTSAIGGAANPLGQLPLGFGPQGQSIVPEAQRRAQGSNPQLITHPLGAQTDDIYEAAVSQLQFDTQSQYARLLQEIGFMGPGGEFMPGTLETDAIRQRAEVERQRELALQDVIEAAVRGGTVFSGRRAKNTAQAQQPFDAAIGELTTRLSRELAGRYQSLAGLTQQFEIGRNMLIAEAAERAKAALLGGPVGGEPPPGGDGAAGGTMRMPAISTLAGQLGGTAGGNAALLNTLPPGARIVVVPNQGERVVDASGRVIGYIDRQANRFVPLGQPVGGSAASRPQ